MKTTCLVGLLLSLFVCHSGFAQDGRNDEVGRLLAGLESPSWVQRVNSAKIISRAGLQDEVLYQKVAELLRAGYAREFEKNHTDEMSWMCKALAASGDPQYLDLLNEVALHAPSPKLQNYARQSAELFDQYARRSRTMNATANWDEELSAEENRLVNMLHSDDLDLRRDAAKLIVRRSGTHDKVFTGVAATLTEMAKPVQFSSLEVDTMAWLCKALAASGNQKYGAVLDQLIADLGSGGNAKLIAHAQKARNSLK